MIVLLPGMTVIQCYPLSRRVERQGGAHVDFLQAIPIFETPWLHVPTRSTMCLNLGGLLVYHRIKYHDKAMRGIPVTEYCQLVEAFLDFIK